jgi:hypothetical protein
VKFSDIKDECRRNIALMMKEASTSEMPDNFYETTQGNNPEDSHL